MILTIKRYFFLKAIFEMDTQCVFILLGNGLETNETTGVAW